MSMKNKAALSSLVSPSSSIAIAHTKPIRVEQIRSSFNTARKLMLDDRGGKVEESAKRASQQQQNQATRALQFAMTDTERQKRLLNTLEEKHLDLVRSDLDR